VNKATLCKRKQAAMLDDGRVNFFTLRRAEKCLLLKEAKVLLKSREKISLVARMSANESTSTATCGQIKRTETRNFNRLPARDRRTDFMCNLIHGKLSRLEPLIEIREGDALHKLPGKRHFSA